MEHHHHDHEQVLDAEKLAKLLEHLKGHNEHHAHEIFHLSDNAKELGKDDVAELLKKASAIFDEGNAVLDEALKKL